MMVINLDPLKVVTVKVLKRIYIIIYLDIPLTISTPDVQIRSNNAIGAHQ